MIAAPRASLQLTLVRHGETEWSVSGRHTGRTDIALTARGEDGARAIAPHLSGVAFARVLTSPRVRARQTCALAGLGTAAEIEPELAEWNYGEYEGLRSSDIQKERPGWNIFLDGCPGGESPAQVAARADHVFDRLRASGGEVALFTHGHFGRALAARWIGLSVAEGQYFSLGVASISVLGFEPSHPETAAIALWNFSASAKPWGV